MSADEWCPRADLLLTTPSRSQSPGRPLSRPQAYFGNASGSTLLTSAVPPITGCSVIV
jgi:hypothetical protein